MPDTGEDGEITRRVNAHQAEVVRRENIVVQKTKQTFVKKQSKDRDKAASSHSRDSRD